ncbi:30S ribosome-binding factor RbfA [Tissierella sp. Yu-01]|uniref:30S ribosome-binding factor RbfA n=1 Tax=Tissierella sp. Yu-01 TaxID=3035694 RepID=UPI00240DA75F|nr:30S ribosome-binding factor RbfA [Tissierella sp. Yu-01]WFA09761.1 30S ribosome-binding factor RbfA [Tissierella sp. Yu-01]
MNIKRVNRISEEVRKVVSELIFNGLKDPRIGSMTTITRVDVTRDLRFAKIYVSVLGEEDVKLDTIVGLNSAKGFIRKEIGNRIELRYAPEPIFFLDESIENAIHMSKLIEEVNKDIHTNKDEDNE